MVPDELNVYLWREGFHLFFPMRGTDHWRLVGILPRNLRDKDDVTFDEVIPSLTHEAGAGLTFQACSWFSTYRIHHRRAARFRDRRCFLLGDAAHIHSPMGAQGMNTGLQDAYNLAWKLALVVSGRAAPGAARLLRGGAHSRRAAAAEYHRPRLLAHRVRHGAGWSVPHPGRGAVAAFAMSIERMQKLAFRTISQTGIRYPESPFRKHCRACPTMRHVPGTAFPGSSSRLRPAAPARTCSQALDDTQFTLLLFGQELTGRIAGSRKPAAHRSKFPSTPSTIRNFAARMSREPSFYLLRPDGYVGLAGTIADRNAITRYLNDSLHLSS